ncbi:hypothetical protein CR513_55601, partial [Mucuna pruriens]
MEFGNTFVKFNTFEALKHLIENHSIFNIDAINRLVEEYVRIGTRLLTLLIFMPTWGIIMIITNNLNREQEEKLLDVLRRHKKAIG